MPLFLTCVNIGCIITTMITVLFPVGCYGTYVTRCMYHYTNLSGDTDVNFLFDAYGSSHVHRLDSTASKFIKSTHNYKSDDSILYVSPLQEHNLDYVNNQFAKESKYDIPGFLDVTIGKEQLIDKLNTHWGIKVADLNAAPKWAIREFLSFYIPKFFEKSYVSLDSGVQLLARASTVDVCNDIHGVISKFAASAGLIVKVDKSVIDLNHFRFLSKQLYHNSQIRCNKWVDDCLLGVDSASPCLTLFDEAYVQCRLRDRKYEIQAAGLNTFPSTAKSLRKIIY